MLISLLIADDDYDPVPSPNFLTFFAGSIAGDMMCIFILVEEDQVDEGDEEFVVTIEAVDPEGLTVDPDQATVIIEGVYHTKMIAPSPV